MILAPQLRQSLEMLQMPVLELRAAILKEMSVNPTIEDLKDPAEVMMSAAMPDKPQEHVTDAGLDFNPDVDAILKQDDEWRDYFMQGMENASSSEDAEEKRQYMFDSVRQHVSLLFCQPDEDRSLEDSIALRFALAHYKHAPASLAAVPSARDNQRRGRPANKRRR